MNKMLKGKTLREKLLLFGLIIALVFGSYLMLRVKPMVVEIQKAEADYKKAKSKYARLLKDTGNVKPSHRLEKELRKLEKQLIDEQQNLKGFDVNFINISDQEAIFALVAEITLAAETNQLQILSKQNEMQELAALVTPKNNTLPATPRTTANKGQQSPSRTILQSALRAKNSKLKRHVFKLDVRGTFPSVYQFLQSLHELDHSVLIARMNLIAEDKVTFQGRRLVTAKLTLAI